MMRDARLWLCVSIALRAITDRKLCDRYNIDADFCRIAAKCVIVSSINSVVSGPNVTKLYTV